MKRSQLVSLSVPWKEERKICHSHFLKGSYGVVNSDSVTDLWFCQLRQVLSGFFSPFGCFFLRYLLELHLFSHYRVTDLRNICIHGCLIYRWLWARWKVKIYLTFTICTSTFCCFDHQFKRVWKLIFGGSENVTKFLKWKRTVTTSKGFTLTFWNKSRMRNETDQPYFVSFIRLFFWYIRSLWRIEIKCYRGHITVAVEYVSFRLVFSVWYGHFLLVGEVNPHWSL